MLLRKINHILNLYLCQSADWQCVIEAADNETAATLALEKVMLNTGKENNFCLSSMVVVKKLSNNLIEGNEDFETVSFYAPVILANAGFHVEANNLHLNLLKQMDDFNHE
jgi:hypothetical protein